MKEAISRPVMTPLLVELDDDSTSWTVCLMVPSMVAVMVLKSDTCWMFHERICSLMASFEMSMPER